MSNRSSENDNLLSMYRFGYEAGVRAARIQIFIVVMAFGSLFAAYQVANGAESADEYESYQLDEDEPDQDPVYDEDDPVYDEEDDYDEPDSDSL